MNRLRLTTALIICFLTTRGVAGEPEIPPIFLPTPPNFVDRPSRSPTAHPRAGRPTGDAGGGVTAQDCSVCDQQVTLTTVEARCFVERVDGYLEEAKTVDPVLINLGECTAQAASHTEPIRGDPEIIPKSDGDQPRCEGEACGEPARFAFLSGRQLRCLADVLPDLLPAEDGLIRYDFVECE